MLKYYQLGSSVEKRSNDPLSNKRVRKCTFISFIIAK